MQYRSSSKAKLARKKAEQNKAPELQRFDHDIFDVIATVGLHSPAEAIRSANTISSRRQTGDILTQPLKRLPHHTKGNFGTSFSNDSEHSAERSVRNICIPNQPLVDTMDQQGQNRVSVIDSVSDNHGGFDCDDLPDDISGIFED